MDKGLQRLYANQGKLNYKHANLLSCMTLDVENCHSPNPPSTISKGTQSVVKYCRSFGVAMEEAVKRMTSWAASRWSWYPKPEGSLLLSQVLFTKPLANVAMCPADCDALRNWTSSYGAAVRRRTVRQETTMAQHGTLSEFMYQRQCEIAEEPIYIAFDAQINTAEAVTENETAEELKQKMSLAKVVKKKSTMVRRFPR